MTPSRAALAVETAESMLKARRKKDIESTQRKRRNSHRGAVFEGGGYSERRRKGGTPPSRERHAFRKKIPCGFSCGGDGRVDEKGRSEARSGRDGDLEMSLLTK